MTDVGAQQRSLLSKTCQDPANGEKQLNYATPQKIEKQIHTKQVLDYSSPSDLALQSIYLSIYIIDYIYIIYTLLYVQQVGTMQEWTAPEVAKGIPLGQIGL
jgi:hypothetical protein